MQDGIYQLQRRAHEAQGNGTWKKLTDEVPVTSENTPLPDLPIETLPIPDPPMSPTQSVQSQYVNPSASSTHSAQQHSANHATTPIEEQPAGQGSPIILAANITAS